MNKKINVFTLLIFVYSVVVCLTCKRDVSNEVSRVPVQKVRQAVYTGSGMHDLSGSAVLAPSMRTSRN